MWEIAFIACSIVSGAQCQDKHLVFEPSDGVLAVYACGMNAQVELAKWTAEHPNWWITGWHCGEAGLYARI